eukprot:3076742-Prymnesium_polylepis.1
MPVHSPTDRSAPGHGSCRGRTPRVTTRLEKGQKRRDAEREGCVYGCGANALVLRVDGRLAQRCEAQVGLEGQQHTAERLYQG